MGSKNQHNTFKDRLAWNQRLQSIALTCVYPRLWPPPRYTAFPIDLQQENPTAMMFDIGGADKVFKGKNGQLILVADRYRAYEDYQKGYDDFTVRESEYKRHIGCISIGGMIPEFYVYGISNEEETDFLKVRVLYYRKWITDIWQGKARKPRLKDMRGKQENFYYEPWKTMPPRYILKEILGPCKEPSHAPGAP